MKMNGVVMQIKHCVENNNVENIKMDGYKEENIFEDK